MTRKLIFKEDEYSYKELWRLHASGKTPYKEGIVKDLLTEEEFDISQFDDHKYIYTEETLDNLKDLSDESTLRNKLKLERNAKRLSDLNKLFEEGEITPKELKELIVLKYKSKYIKETMNYEHYAFFNLDIEIPDLSDADLGKFYKILTKLTKQANSLLKTKNTASNPVTILEIAELLNISDKSVYKFLSKLKKLGIIKNFSYGEKKYMSINPLYIINGNITSTSYFIFKDDMEKLFPNIPKEIIKLWEFEFVNSTIYIE